MTESQIIFLILCATLFIPAVILIALLRPDWEGLERWRMTDYLLSKMAERMPESCLNCGWAEWYDNKTGDGSCHGLNAMQNTPIAFISEVAFIWEAHPYTDCPQWKEKGG